MPDTEFRVSQFKNRNGVTSWRLSGWLAGVRIRKNFKSRQEAAAEKGSLDIQAAQLAAGVRSAATFLTDPQLREAESAFRRLMGRPHTLSTYLDFAIANFREPVVARPITEAIAAHLAKKRREHERDLLSTCQLNNIAREFAVYEKTFPGRSLHEFAANELVAYLKRNMHASDEEITRFRTQPYRSIEIFTIDEKTGEVVGFSFDSLRCIATGRGRRDGMRESIDWVWHNGHQSTRIIERVDADRMIITQRTPMPDGSVMEEKGEAVRRRVPAPAPAEAKATEVAVVEAFVAAINAQDLAALSALMTDDHTFIDPADRKIAGREAMLAVWPQYFAMFPDYRFRVDRMVGQGSVVVVLGSWSGTFAGKRGTAAEYAVGGPAAWSAEVSEGRIKVCQVYADHTRTNEVVSRDRE